MYRVVRLPSPVNAPLAMDVIWLRSRYLREQLDEIIGAHESASQHTVSSVVQAQ
jgi:hypothetical protein